MRRAIAAGASRTEATAWSLVQLGNLYVAKNDLVAADLAYADALSRVDGYVFALAGQARVRAARGDLVGAAQLDEAASQRLPVPDFVIALADLHARLGDATRASHDADLVVAMERLLKANGVRTDVDLALFDADHDLRLGDALAAARAEYGVRASIFEMEGVPEATAREALRLGWRDPAALHRADEIARATHDVELARRVAELSHS